MDMSNLEPIPITSQKHDPAWKHCLMFKNGDRVQLKCLYCGKFFKGGGIHRIKEHLAGQKGNASTCLQVPSDVRVMMQQSLDGVVVKKRKKQKVTEDISNLNPGAVGSFGGDQIEDSTGVEMIGLSNVIESGSSLLTGGEGEKVGKVRDRRRRGRIKGCSNANANVNVVASVNDVRSMLGAERVNDHVHMSIGRFLYDIGAPLDAMNSVYFQPMIDAISSAGSDVVMPSYHDLRGWILKSSVEEVKTDVDKLMATWATTGCSVLVDQWNTLTGKTLLNFLAYCSEGVVFLKSVDASDIINSSDALYELLKQVVEEVGVKHVLQVITRMEEQYCVAGKRLSDTFPSLYWAPCAAHCIDLILEDFANLELINTAIQQARSVTRFVYNHSAVLNMVRRYTFGKDIVEPGLTRFVTNFQTLNRMVDLKHALQAMVTSQEWMDCPYSKSPGGLEVLDILSNQSFWSSCVSIMHLTNPILRVLRIVSSKKRPAMGYVYAGMYQAKEAIKKELVKRKEYMVYWNIIDHWWGRQSSLPLHTAGFFFNPKFFYSIERDLQNEILLGTLDCIEKLVPDANIQDKIIKELHSYKNASGDFGRKMAVRARDALLPTEWWSTYGGSCPNLVRFSLRILCQTCSSIGYEQNHTSVEQLHNTKNCLERQRLSDLVFVQYNSRLKPMDNKNEERDSIDPLSFDKHSLLEDWIKDKGLNTEDYANSDWMALDPLFVKTGLLGPSHEEADELTAGFNDYEIFNRVKDNEDANEDENQ